MNINESPRFCADVCRNLKIQKEYLKGCDLFNPFFRCMRLTLTLILIWFFFQMIPRLGINRYSLALPLMVLLWIIFWGIRAFSHRQGGKAYRQRQLKHPGETLHDSVLFFEDRILIREQEGDTETAVDYSHITAVFETRNLFLFSMKSGGFFMAGKSGLAENRQAFWDFLLSKSVHIRPRKIQRCLSAKIAVGLQWTVIVFSLAFALFFHPWFQIINMVQGQIHNGMPMAQIAAELEGYGISGADPAQVDEMDSPFFYLANGKLKSLLLHLGTASYDASSGTMIPSPNGVFYTDYYWNEPEGMYTNLLLGIQALSNGNLIIDQIREDQSQARWEESSGVVTIDFTLNGSPCHLEANVNKKRYDEKVFGTLGDWIFEATGLHLYISDFEYRGCFLFLGDEQWAASFYQRTGMWLVTDLYQFYYGY